MIDFKTDRATEETLESVIRRYQPQIRAYAQALSRIYQMPVKESYLYLFHLGQFVTV